MKRITLPKILHSLETMTTEVTVDPAIAARARRAVERMLASRDCRSNARPRERRHGSAASTTSSRPRAR